MATAVAKLGAVINFGNGASVTVFEGDLVLDDILQGLN